MDLLLAEVIDLTRLVPLAVFGAFAVVAWWLMNRFAADKPRAEQRLDDFREAPARRAEAARGTAVRKNEGMARFFEKASPALAKPLQSSNVNETNRLKERLAHAGFRGDGAPSIYLGLKVMVLGAGFFLGGGGMILAKGFTQESIMYTVAIAGIAFYVPEVVLWFLGRSRKEAIFLSLPDALDLMVVCVEAGLGLDQAMRKVADEMKATYRIIAGEFAMCNFQLQMGRARTDVLHELGYRTGVDDLRALAAILIQADKFGSSIAQALRVQSDSMRIRRRQLAEERAAKTAVKLIFPLVLFIFPAIFVVLVGPAAITMINEMFPAMSGGS